MSYKHLSIIEREMLMKYLARGYSLCKIAKLTGRNKSTISRELKRNPGEYFSSKAQANYQKRRKKCGSKKKLSDDKLFKLVKRLFLEEHWSPEQIAARLKLENYPIRISYKTIYRAIYAGMFDTPQQRRSTGNRGAIRKLRHKGKPRRLKGYVSNRGKIPISHELKERPVAANERMQLGDVEVDTIVGFKRESGLLTMVDRKSRFLYCRKLSRIDSRRVATGMVECLRGQPLHTLTPDRGREFQRHCEVTLELGAEFYFPPPHQPWQRGTGENTNGLLREYFPKGFDFNTVSDEQVQAVVDQLNQRPRKCLGYRTPVEIHFSKVLHLT